MSQPSYEYPHVEIDLGSSRKTWQRSKSAARLLLSGFLEW